MCWLGWGVFEREADGRQSLNVANWVGKSTSTFVVVVVLGCCCRVGRVHRVVWLGTSFPICSHKNTRINQRRLSLLGVAETLEMTEVGFEHPESSRRALVHSLRSNRSSSKRLKFSMSVLNWNYEKVNASSIAHSWRRPSRQSIRWRSVHNVLWDILCREDCSLKTLYLTGVAPWSRLLCRTEWTLQRRTTW